jgi:hypothetical protein
MLLQEFCTGGNHRMNQDKLIKRIDKWLERDGNSVSKLAWLLGYESSETIRRWLRERSVPAYRSKEIERVLNDH